MFIKLKSNPKIILPNRMDMRKTDFV